MDDECSAPFVLSKIRIATSGGNPCKSPPFSVFLRCLCSVKSSAVESILDGSCPGSMNRIRHPIVRLKALRKSGIDQIPFPAHPEQIRTLMRHIRRRAVKGLSRFPMNQILRSAQAHTSAVLLTGPDDSCRQKHVVAILVLIVKNVGIPPVKRFINGFIRTEYGLRILRPVNQIPACRMSNKLKRPPLSMIFRIVIILSRVKNMKPSVSSLHDRPRVAGVIRFIKIPRRKHNAHILHVDSVFRNQKIPACPVTILIFRMTFPLIMQIKDVKFAIVGKRNCISYPSILRLIKNTFHCCPVFHKIRFFHIRLFPVLCPRRFCV